MTEETIDFKKLEVELSKAVEADEKYQRENDAKFRAVAQKVANYDEFRDIVLASNLKPLNKEDKVGGVAYQHWNSASNKKANHEQVKTEETKVTVKLPNTEAEFSRDWKTRCKLSKDKYEYLVHIVGSNHLRKVLKFECEVAEITEALNTNFDSADAQEILDILNIVCCTKRFLLSMDFMETKEIEIVKSLFTKLEEILQVSGDLKLKYKVS